MKVKAKYAAIALLLLMCGCAKEENEAEASDTTVSVSAITTVPEDELPEIKFSEKATYFIESPASYRSGSTGSPVNNVLPLKDGEPLTFRAADGSGDAMELSNGDEFLGWTLDSLMMFANDNSSFQARFSSDEREFEGTLTIHVSEYTEELEAAFVPDDMSLFPKASSDGRTLWFAADNLDETLEMLGYSADDTFEKEEVTRVKLRTDRIYINNLPLDDVNNLIRVLDIEKL